ncbi:MAG TPA: hypothetical protein VD771_10060 [Gemmatimonadaceae bacterium]|nr:hypothetical protein [Gemmatimonadaceae bacterium]
MPKLSKTYILLGYGGWCILGGADHARAQGATAADVSQSSCAAVLANDSTVGTRLGLAGSTSGGPDTSARSRSDSASFGVGGARNGQADVLLLVGVHADEVKFASQPHIHVRLCWGGDTVRVVQRDNIPSPVVPGTTYRNVYIAVELLGRVNAECLAEKIGVGSSSLQRVRPTNVTATGDARAPEPVGTCAFLGGTATQGTPSTRPPP